jgi:hypothetical protein
MKILLFREGCRSLDHYVETFIAEGHDSVGRAYEVSLGKRIPNVGTLEDSARAWLAKQAKKGPEQTETAAPMDKNTDTVRSLRDSIGALAQRIDNLGTHYDALCDQVATQAEEIGQLDQELDLTRFERRIDAVGQCATDARNIASGARDAAASTRTLLDALARKVDAGTYKGGPA